MKRLAFRLSLSFFSAGWILPLTASFAAFYDFVWRIVWPVASCQDGAAVRPFHMFSLADELFCTAMIWLPAVIIYWVIRATRQ